MKRDVQTPLTLKSILKAFAGRNDVEGVKEKFPEYFSIKLIRFNLFRSTIQLTSSRVLPAHMEDMKLWKENFYQEEIIQAKELLFNEKIIIKFAMTTGNVLNVFQRRSRSRRVSGSGRIIKLTRKA